MNGPRLHLQKLCVGVDGPEDLARRQAANGRYRHVTRMWPRREAELMAGGSLYWVMKGAIACRQRILGLEETRGEDGLRRCRILLGRDLVRVAHTPRRAFQGWRYLAAEDAPPDLGRVGANEDELPQNILEAMAVFGIR